MKALLILLGLLALTHCNWIGIDVSEWQGNINWGAVKTAKYFAIIRAGWGSGGVDKFYQQNYNGAKAAGVKLGAYLYSYANSVGDAQAEANHFISLLRGKQFEWPVYYDIEEGSIFNRGIQNDIARSFCSILEANRFYCGIYSSASRLNSQFAADVKQKYSIWVAHWGVPAPSYYGTYHIWQRSESEGCPGIAGNVDQDIGYIDFEPVMKKAHLNGY